MQEYNYKEEIIASRVGCLGSSDGKLLVQIATLGYVPKSAYNRLAIVKGLIPPVEIPETAAIRTGNEIEMQVYQSLKLTDERWVSNFMWKSEKYSFENCALISHPDFLLIDEEKQTIFIGECKATKYTVEQTRQTYKAQLFIHYMLGLEQAAKLGKKWRVKLLLVHYNTEGLDLSEGVEFDPSRLTVNNVRISTSYFDLYRTMQIVNNFLSTFNEYYAGEEVDADLLPEKVRSEFNEIATFLTEIQEREEKVAQFKGRLFQFMKTKEIKSIKCDAFSIVRVDDTVSKSFDYKRYVDDLKLEHPRKANKVIAKYTKETKKRGYCQIKVNKNKDVEDIFK